MSIYAARRTSGELTLLVVSVNDDAKSVPLRIDNFAPMGEAEVWLLDSDHNAENMGIQPLNDALHLPPQSATLYIIQGQ